MHNYASLSIMRLNIKVSDVQILLLNAYVSLVILTFGNTNSFFCYHNFTHLLQFPSLLIRPYIYFLINSDYESSNLSIELMSCIGNFAKDFTAHLEKSVLLESFVLAFIILFSLKILFPRCSSCVSHLSCYFYDFYYYAIISSLYV